MTSRVQPPCSGWSAKARLLTSTHASSSCPGTNARNAIGGHGFVDWQRHEHLEQIAFGLEPGRGGRGVVRVEWIADPPTHLAAAAPRIASNARVEPSRGARRSSQVRGARCDP